MPLTLASNAITFTDNTALSSGVIGTEQLSAGAITAEKLANTVQQLLVPAGCVMSFAMSAAPIGWYPCDGTTITRTGSGANLFAAIGTIYGAGDNSTTFNVPDLRGIFIRGSGSQTISGITYSKTFAAKEQDAMQGHWHQYTGTTSDVAGGTGGIIDGPNTQIGGGGNLILGPITDGSNGTPRIANETRPVNIALLYCIKL